MDMMQNITVSLQKLCFRPGREDLNQISFEVHRIVSGDKVTVILNGKLDSNNNVDTLTASVRVGHPKIKTFAEIQAKKILHSTALPAVVT
jgi:hypothetical protein